MSGIHLGNNSVPPVYNPPSQGSPGNSGDGIDYPYDPNGTTPNFWINWNDPHLTVAEIEKQYQGLLDWLKENPGSGYNGSLLLLQFTTDIGQHLNDPRFAGSDLAKFVSNQIYYGGGQYYLQDVLQLAAYGSAVGQPNLAAGIAAATKFLQAILAATSGDTGAADIFNKLHQEAANLLDSSNPNNITAWCTSHWDTSIPGSPGGVWVDDETAGTDPDINGPQPMDFSDFAADATFYLGSIIQPPGGASNSSVNAAIDGMYGLSIEQIFTQYKGNPWLILILLMSKITTSRDSDKGRAVNGYSGILTSLNNANKYIANMLADLNAPQFDAKDFYKNLNALKALVGKNPSLANIYTELQKDFSQINSQQITPPLEKGTKNTTFTIRDSGYYNYPPGMQITVDGKVMTVPANGVIYLPAGTTVSFSLHQAGLNTTMGQLAAMGDYDAIDAAMNGTAGNPVGWNATVKSTLTSSMTAMTSLLNGQSAAINQQMSQVVQEMQALENYLKQMLGSITSQNQTIVKNIQALLG
jgi:hypothetical protein